jgi:hypothetical protein
MTILARACAFARPVCARQEPADVFSQTTEYALRIVVYLASLGERPATIAQIAAATRVPAGYLAKVLVSLSRGIVIVEGLDLSAPPRGTYELYCLPLLLAGIDGAPSRAVLVG